MPLKAVKSFERRSKGRTKKQRDHWRQLIELRAAKLNKNAVVELPLQLEELEVSQESRLSENSIPLADVEVKREEEVAEIEIIEVVNTEENDVLDHLDVPSCEIPFADPLIFDVDVTVKDEVAEIDDNSEDIGFLDNIDKTQQCVVCLGSKTSGSPWWTNFNLEKDSPPVLDKHLSSIFLLRKILNISKEKCTSLFQKSFGVNPGEWCGLCEPCSNIFRNSVLLHEQISGLERKREEVNQEMRRKLEESLIVDEFFGRKQQGTVVDMHHLIRDCFRDMPENTSGGTIQNDFSRRTRSPSIRRKIRKFTPEVKSVKVTLRKYHRQKTKLKLPSVEPEESLFGEGEACQKVLKCDLCPCKFFKVNAYRAHKIQHKRHTRHICEICKYPCTTAQRLENHHKRHSNPKPKVSPLKCLKCGYEAKRGGRDMRGHMRQHKMLEYLEIIPETVDNFRCKLCLEKGTKRTMLRHLRDTHSEQIGVKVETCHVVSCGKLFSFPGDLQSHVKRHHENHKRHICPICGREFVLKRSYEDHINTHKNGGKSTIICDICGLVYATQTSLRNHFNQFHSGKRKKPENNKLTRKSRTLKCKHCPIEVIHDKALKLHLKTNHPELYKYKCDMCDAAYTQPGGLETHKKAKHLGDKVNCPYCLKEFGCKDYLKGHWKQWCKKYPGSNGNPQGTDNSTLMTEENNF